VFGGGTNRITLANAISLGTVFTLSAWINPANLTGAYKAIFAPASGTAVGLFLKSTGKLSWWFSAADHLSTASIATSTWTHVALVSDGVRATFYINGVADAVVAVSAFTVGQLGNDSSNEAWVGSLDEMGVWTRALAPSEITTLYNAGSGTAYPFGASLASRIVAYWPLNGNSTDALGGYNGSDTLVSYAAAKIGNGATFTGASTSAINLPVVTPMTGTTPRTFSAWVKKGARNTFSAIFQGGGGTDLGWFSVWMNGTTSGDIYASFYNSDFYTVGGLIGSDRFYHIVVCYDGGVVSTSTIRIYVDGVLKPTTKAGTATAEANTGGTSFTIGGDSFNRNNDGSIDEVGIWDRALFPSEVAALYNAGSGITYPF
jgi:hypothetical protein